LGSGLLAAEAGPVTNPIPTSTGNDASVNRAAHERQWRWGLPDGSDEPVSALRLPFMAVGVMFDGIT